MGNVFIKEFLKSIELENPAEYWTEKCLEHMKKIDDLESEVSSLRRLVQDIHATGVALPDPVKTSIEHLVQRK
jgi:hypothetical protein